MEGFDLWSEASRDVEAEDRASRLAHATAALADLWPWFSSAKSNEELAHRKALASESLSTIASRTGVELGEVEGIVDRHHALLREAADSDDDDDSDDGDHGDDCDCSKCDGSSDHDSDDDDSDDSDDDSKVPPQFRNSSRKHYALPEGMDPLEWVKSIMPGQGTPEKPDSHTTQFDGSGGYSEVPAGPLPGGPNPNVVVPEHLVPQEDGWETPQNKALHGGQAEIAQQTQGRTRAESARRTAAPGDPTAMPGDPLAGMPGAGGGGMGGGSMPGQPDMSTGYPTTTKPRQIPGGGAGGGGDMGAGMGMGPDLGTNTGLAGAGPVSDTNGPQQTGDMIGDQVNRVAARVQQDNPTLDVQSCRRVARKVVASYLTKRADDIDYVGNQDKQKQDGEEDDTGSGAGAAMMGGAAVMRALPLLEL